MKVLLRLTVILALIALAVPTENSIHGVIIEVSNGGLCLPSRLNVIESHLMLDHLPLGSS
jgi:hypothetical protein